MMRIEILDGDIVINTVIASEEWAEQNFPGAWRFAAEQQPALPETPSPRHISVGAFFDRFGAEKWQILADQSPAVQGVIKDASVRKYIDLDNADLPGGLAILQAAGYNIDPAAIIDAEIQPRELP